jgi:predicted NACHT family NTPase
MARQSLRVDPEKLKKVKRVFELTGWTQDELASEVDLCTRQPIGKFLNGKTVDRKYFQEICFRLDLDWKEVAYLPKNIESEQEDKEQSNAPSCQYVESEIAEKVLDNSWDIDMLVRILQVSPDKLEQVKQALEDFPSVIQAKGDKEGKEKANKFIKKLNLRENQPIREIAVTPILLILTCLVFQSKTEFPSNRAKLYEEGLEILLKKWDESRGIERDNTYKTVITSWNKINYRNLLETISAPYQMQILTPSNCS